MNSFYSATRWLLVCGLACCVGCGSSTSPTQPTVIRAPAAPGQTTFTGIATDSDTGDPLEDVRVSWLTGLALSAADGEYSMTGPLPSLPPGAVLSNYRPCPHAGRNGYESRQVCVTLDATGTARWSPVLQRRVTINAGQTFRAAIAAGDGYGLVMELDECVLCRAVHINVPEAGVLAFQLTSETPGFPVRLSLPYQSLGEDGTLEVAGAREVVALVSSGAAPARFALSTTFTRR